MNRAPSIDTDVVVVGGGPAGAATAIRLARAGRAVIVTERTDYDHPRMGETLPGTVTSELSELEVLDAFDALRPMPALETASAWGAATVAARSCIFDPYGHGWHVDRAQFDAMLAQSAVIAGATVIRRAHVLDVVGADDGALTVTVEQGGRREVLRSAQVVDASGRKAQVARVLGGTSRRVDHLVAVSVCCDVASGVTAGDTFVEAVADGWWYVSPLPDRGRIIALFTDASISRSAGLTDPSAWWAALQRTEHVARLARQASPTSRPRVTSAASRVLAPAVGNTWIAVGDAALAVDPLSSSGVATALRSARLAAGVLTASVEARAERAAAYDTWVAEAAGRYLRDRARYYELEERFAEAPFWRARRAGRGHRRVSGTPSGPETLG